MSIPDPTTIPQLSESEVEFILDNLFEPCRTLTGILIPTIKSHTFTTYTELIEHCRTTLLQVISEYKKEPNSSSKSVICKIVGAHPRLGVPKTTVLSDHSQSEQKSLSGGSSALAAQLMELNSLYEQTFPGLIFVVFVNGRSRDEIMNIMSDRITNSTWINEVTIAFNEMCEIALDRANKLNAKL